MNKSQKQHPTKQQLYYHLPPISETIQVGQTRYAGHCWGNKDKHISDFLLWTPTHGHTSDCRPTRTYVHHLWADTGYRLEDIPSVINYKYGWWERIRKLQTISTTWWYMYIYIYIYVCVCVCVCVCVSSSILKNGKERKPLTQCRLVYVCISNCKCFLFLFIFFYCFLFSLLCTKCLLTPFFICEWKWYDTIAVEMVARGSNIKPRRSPFPQSQTGPTSHPSENRFFWRRVLEMDFPSCFWIKRWIGSIAAPNTLKI